MHCRARGYLGTVDVEGHDDPVLPAAAVATMVTAELRPVMPPLLLVVTLTAMTTSESETNTQGLGQLTSDADQ